MKISKTGYIFLSIGILIISGYLIFSIIQFADTENETLCTDFHIYYPENSELKLVTKEEIATTLNNAELHPIGEKYKDICGEKIEDEIRKNKLIKKVECFKTPSGEVYLKVYQRIPLYLIAGNESFYVDTQKELMPVSLNNALYVPVASGNITMSMAKGELFDFAKYISENKFWDSQIEQIYIHPDKTVELIPRVGDVMIFFGTLDNFVSKLIKLELLYTQGFSHIGWDRYEKIDLQHDNQIVCTLKPKKKS